MGRGNTSGDAGKTGILNQLKAYLDRSKLGELLVIKGAISTQDLRYALSLQKIQQKPLGRIMVENSIISRRQLAYILARQSALRMVATMLVLAFAGAGTSKRANAGELTESPISVSMSAGQNYSKIASYPALLGTNEKRSANLAAFTKWMGVFSRFDRETRSASAEGSMREWRENLTDLKGLPLMAMAKRVNDIMNTKPYILDNKNWGKSDYWETPVEFMRKGGDCEDFAIAKYIALQQLGVPEERLRVAIVQDTYKNIPHAVLIVYADDGVFILDQQIKSVMDASGSGRYKPIFSINRQAWWLHSGGEATQVASR